MKLLLLPAIILFVCISPQNNFSQKTSLCDLIGKKVNAVISQYGKPNHHDKSNPSMECVFYQSKTSRMAFIADREGIYQIQVDYYYNSKNDAEKAMNGFMADCYAKSMTIDTLKINDFRISTHGVKMNLTLFENSYTKKHEIKFKAERSESK